MADLIGKTIDQYQIVEQIGQGGMATVYKAYQPSINRHVAIKILPSQFARDPNFVKRFEHEAKAIAALEHPHILPVFDFGAKGDLYYMVMRYVSGGTLTDLMTKSISYERAVDIIGPIARALDYAHSQGVVHRDIKPSNILIDKNGEPLLTDFGIAKLIESSEGATQLTGAGSILGTPAYMAPEQAKGARVDRRTDIYSLGVVLYELLVGRPPFQGDTALAVVLMHISEPLPSPRKINPSVPEALERVVVKAMAKEPAQRYQTALELEHALKDAMRQIEAAGMTIASPANRAATGSRAAPGTGIGAGATGTQAEPARPAAKTGRNLGPLFIIGGLLALLVCVAAGGLTTWAIFSPGGTSTPLSRVTAEARVTLAVPEPSVTPSPSEATATPAAVEPGPTPTSSDSKDNINVNQLAPGTLLVDEFVDDRYCWADRGNHLFGNYRSEIRNGSLRLNMQAKQGATFYGTIPGVDYADVVVSVEATPSNEGSPPVGYGLIFRSNPKGDYYLFEIRENSQFAVYLIYHDQDEWQRLIEPTLWSAIKTDGPNELMVQAGGPSFTFFINGEQVGQVNDSTIPSGSVGVLIEMNEGDDTTVDFDNLVARLPDGAPVETGGNILLIDCFNANDNGWSVGSFSDTGFKSDTSIDGKYKVSITARQEDGYVYRDEIPGKKFDDFVLSVQAIPQDSETDYTYGVVFRKTGQIFYTFEIGNNGKYGVYLFNNEWKTILDGTTRAVNAGSMNEIRVIAQGDRLVFLVNGEQVARVIDSTSLVGQVGLVNSVLENGKSAILEFDNLVVTELSSYSMNAGSPFSSSGDGLVLFSDSFDSDEHGWTTGETESDYSLTTVTIAEGKYSLAATAKKPAYIQKNLPGYEFGDFILSVDATPRDSETYYAYGVAFRETEDGETYTFEISNDGTYSVHLYKDQEWQALQAWVESEAIKPGQTNELMVMASGSSLMFFANGELLTTLEDSNTLDGRMGLVMEIFNEGESATVDFDNLTVQANETGG